MEKHDDGLVTCLIDTVAGIMERGGQEFYTEAELRVQLVPWSAEHDMTINETMAMVAEINREARAAELH